MRTLILIATASLILSSCKQAELDRSNEQKDSLISVLKEREVVLTEKETSLNDFISSFNEVERNLDSVAVKQKIINLNTDKSQGEIKGSQKERINEQINAINDLMDKNRRTIAELSRKLKGANANNHKLQAAIETLNAQLAAKDGELAALNEKLNALHAQVVQLQLSVDSLSTKDKASTQLIAETTTSLHTAYYIIGKTKDLQDARIIDRKGGLLGMGKTSQISEDVDKSKFTKIDYTQTTSIPVNSSKIKIITSHPADSYKLDKDAGGMIKNIVIMAPEKFWGISKFLVIEGAQKK